MSRGARERLDISINLSNLLDVEIRDERGVTKLIIPLDANNIRLSERGGAYLNMIAFPNRNVSFGATHALKQHLPKDHRHKARRLTIGSVYPFGHFDFCDNLSTEKKAKRALKKHVEERENKFKNIDF